MGIGSCGATTPRVLVVVCNIWLSARQAGALQAQQLPKAQKAELLTRALAETGIVALVDEATGYEKVRPQNALQRYLEILVRKELAAWAKKFPDEFYENIYRLKGWTWPGMGKNRYSVVAYYTRDLVYERLGPGLLKELEGKSPKNGDGHRPSRLHQWLTDDVGDPFLAQHLHSLVMLQRLALANGHGWHRFLNSVNLVLPKRGDTLGVPLECENPKRASAGGISPVCQTRKRQCAQKWAHRTRKFRNTRKIEFTRAKQRQGFHHQHLRRDHEVGGALRFRKLLECGPACPMFLCQEDKPLTLAGVRKCCGGGQRRGPALRRKLIHGGE